MAQINRPQGRVGRQQSRWILPLLIFSVFAVLTAVLVRSPKDSTEAARQGKTASAPDQEKARRVAPAGSVISSMAEKNSISALRKKNSAGLPAELQFDAAELSQKVTSSNVAERNRALDQFKNKLMALGALDPRLDSLAVLLREIAPESDAFAALAAAAGAVPVQAVQSVFIDLLNERSADWRMFSAMVPVLGGVAYPLQETLDYLTATARDAEGDFSSTAALALGSSAYTLSKTQPERGEKLVSHYSGVLADRNSGIEEIKMALAVLGNSGLPSAAEPVLAMTKHSRNDVRAEAVMALRFIGSTDAEKRLLEILESEEIAEVRMRVMDALVHRPLSEAVLNTARKILSNSKAESPFIRSRALDLLMHFHFSDGQAKDIRIWLLGLAEKESEMNLKKALLNSAQSLLK
jgi:HEAT repeat protein